MARYTGPTLLHANQNALDLARLAQKRQKGEEIYLHLKQRIFQARSCSQCVCMQGGME